MYIDRIRKPKDIVIIERQELETLLNIVSKVPVTLNYSGETLINVSSYTINDQNVLPEKLDEFQLIPEQSYANGRYWVFYGDFYYPSGGIEDFKKSYNSLDDAKFFCEENLGKLFDWAQVYDTCTGTVEKMYRDVSWKV